MGDFNGDKKLDMAVVTVDNGQNGAVDVFLGDGTGGFSSPTAFPVGTSPISATAIAVGYFNGDKKLDIAVANTGSGNVSILLGNGTGGFSPAATFSAVAHPGAIALGDFNGDGKLDLAVTDNGGSTVGVLLGDGKGGLSTPTTFFAGNGPVALAAVDFNHDNKLDLAVANNGGSNVSILRGNGAGGFSAPTDFPVGLNPSSLATGDFNGDGQLDLVINNAGSNNVSVLLGDGAGSFASPMNFDAGNMPGSLVVGDFNADGKLDVAITPGGNSFPGPSQIAVLLGDGNGGLNAPTFYSAGGTSVSVATGDFDGNRSSDLALAEVNIPSSNVSILLNQIQVGVDLQLTLDDSRIVPAQATDLHLSQFFGKESLQLPVAIQNIGSDLAKGNATISVFLSSTPDLAGSVTGTTPITHTAVTLNLAGSASTDVLVPATISAATAAKLTPGTTYYFVLQLTSTKIKERDNGLNNVAASTTAYDFVGTPQTTAKVFPGAYLSIVGEALQGVNPFGVDPNSITDGQHFTAAFESPGGYEHPNLGPYLDSAGIPTIGIGLNLNSLDSSVVPILAADVRAFYRSEAANGVAGYTNIDSLKDTQVIKMLKDQAHAAGQGGQGQNALTVPDAQDLFERVYAIHLQAASNAFGSGWSSLPSNIQWVLVDVNFNIGTDFPNVLKDLQAPGSIDFARLAFDFLDNKRTIQVGDYRSLAGIEFLLMGHLSDLGQIV